MTGTKNVLRNGYGHKTDDEADGIARELGPFIIARHCYSFSEPYLTFKSLHMSVLKETMICAYWQEDGINESQEGDTLFHFSGHMCKIDMV